MVDGMTRTVTIRTASDAGWESHPDAVSVEEPLELRLTFGPLRRRARVTLAVTMRTPGHDAELFAGLLLAEGIVQERTDILDVASEGNSVRIDLHPRRHFDLDQARRLTTNSACGLCGARTLDGLERHADPIDCRTQFPSQLVGQLPDRLRKAQPTFDRTGGVHAAGLFDAMGELLAAREDVGRHNAVDKLIGAELFADRLPLTGRMVVVSGRVGYELVQKAVSAGVEVLVAVGAPTSLAVEAADRFGLTLVGFVRDGRFNCYSGEGRLA